MNELKPCPFCGGEAELTRYINAYAVQCRECLAIPFEYGDESLAIEAWNTRADDQSQAAAYWQRMYEETVSERTCRDRLGDIEPFEYCGARVEP